MCCLDEPDVHAIDEVCNIYVLYVYVPYYFKQNKILDLCRTFTCTLLMISSSVIAIVLVGLVIILNKLLDIIFIVDLSISDWVTHEHCVAKTAQNIKLRNKRHGFVWMPSCIFAVRSWRY
jgi:hypothetical protein